MFAHNSVIFAASLAPELASALALSVIGLFGALAKYLQKRTQALAVASARHGAHVANGFELAERADSDPPPATSATKLDPLTKSQLRHLHPAVAELAVRLVELCRDDGIPIVVTSGYRSMDSQARLYAQGRTAPGPIVTHARPGTSFHNYGLAFDVAPLDNKNKPHWPNDWSLWTMIGVRGEQLGLTWGGRWKKQTDLPHFEFHPGLTMADVRAGKRPPLPL